MKTSQYLAPLALALVAFVACGRSGAADQNALSPPESSPSQDQDRAGATGGADHKVGEFDTVVGRLIDVDLDAKTFVVSDDEGLQHEFAFTDATEVMGGKDVQGLSSDMGVRIVVTYRWDPVQEKQKALRIDYP